MLLGKAMAWRRWFVVGLIGLALPLAGAPAPGFSVRWERAASPANSGVVEVAGLSAAQLQELRTSNWDLPRWQRLLSVYAEQGDAMADMWLPPMLGNYRADATVLRFEPQFPLVPGVNYRAVFRPEHLPGAAGSPGQPVAAVFSLPVRPVAPTTVVSRIYPTAEVLPENLLKFYVHFSAPMSGGHIYEHIHLRDAAGKDVELPFLEIDEELWNPDMTRLTLFIDPGRIKRGVLPLEEVGPALEAGKQYALVIDRNWKDANGAPLKESFTKRFAVGPPVREPPDPAQWTVHSPAAGTTDPLTIRFPQPMDHALAQRVIRVTDAAGQFVSGQTVLEDQERRWRFVPAGPWRPGGHRLVIQTTIEDLAGNNIGKPFEVDLFEGVQRRLTNSTVKVAFEVR